MNETSLPSAGHRLSADEASELVDHLASGTAAGLPLDEIFLALAEETDQRGLRRAATHVAGELRRGADLHGALAAVRRQVPPYLCRALEASSDLGQTAAVLAGVSDHEIARKRLHRQLRSVLLYPAIVLGLLAAVMAGLTLLVTPQFAALYHDFDLTLPQLTAFWLDSSRYVPPLLGGVAATAILYFVVGLIPGGRRLTHWLRTSVPVVGRLWVWSAHHEFASILGALVAQRVPLDEALQCTAASLRDANLARSARIVAAKCADGAPLSRSLAESIHFDPALVALSAWGESRGDLPAALRQAAITFEEQLELQAAFLRRTMPSLLFIVVISSVFFFITALLVPLVEMIRALSSWTVVPTGSPSGLQVVERFVVSSLALFILGVCLRMSLRLLYGARGPAVDDTVYLILRIVGWGLIVFPMAVMAIAGSNWLSLILLAAILESLVGLVHARRAAQRQAVWRLVTGAIAAGRSLVDVLRMHAARFSGIVGRWQRRLAADVERGVDWRHAVLQNAPAVPREAPTFAAMVPPGARPSPALADLDELRDPAYQQLQQDTGQRLAYLANVSLMIVAVLIYVMIKIVPAYQAIYEDFDLELPAITIGVIQVSEALGETIGIPLLILGLILLPAILVIGVLYLCDIPVLQRLTDRIALFRHRAQVLRLLAAGFEQQKPFDETLKQLSAGPAPYPSVVVRRRLDRAAQRVAAGDPWPDALKRAGLVSETDVAVLRSAQLAGNLPWACRLLAQRKLRLAAFRWALVQQAAFVVVMLMLGFLVFIYAAAMIVPLANLIWNLSS